MFLELNKITIIKKGLTGQASVDYNIFKINKIFIDMSNGSSPISIPMFEKIEIISGKLINDLKEMILELFQDHFLDVPDGIYSVTFEQTVEIKRL